MKTVAIIGASSDQAKFGNKAVRAEKGMSDEQRARSDAPYLGWDPRPEKFRLQSSRVGLGLSVREKL
jgi:hypothetical protein